jgi:hypothetical protein
MIEESRAYWMVVLTLAVLVLVALWQFQSLAWGDDPRGPAVAAAPLSPPQDPVLSSFSR